MAIRAGTARAVVLYMKKGAELTEAVMEAAHDLQALKGGLISRITIHAIDAKGGHKVVAVNGNPENRYWVWTPERGRPEMLPAEILRLHDGAPKPTASLRYGNLEL
jgi:L-asparaginase